MRSVWTWTRRSSAEQPAWWTSGAKVTYLAAWIGAQHRIASTDQHPMNRDSQSQKSTAHAVCVCVALEMRHRSEMVPKIKPKSRSTRDTANVTFFFDLLLIPAKLVSMFLPLSTSQTRTRESVPVERSCWPSGVNLRPLTAPLCELMVRELLLSCSPLY